MKVIWIFLFVALFANLVQGQDTLFRTKFYTLTDTIEPDGFLVIQLDDPDNLYHVYESWYSSGVLHSVHHIQIKPSWSFVDMSQYLYDDGMVRKRVKYDAGKRTGNQETFYSNGQLKRSDLFKNDTLIGSNCFHENGEKRRCIYDHTDARYVYGSDSLTNYLWSTLEYPAMGIMLRLEGELGIYVYVNPDSTTEFAFSKSMHPAFNQTLIDALKPLQFIPAVEDGVPVGSFFSN